MDDLVYRLRKRAEIRRQISTRKSVQEGKPDRVADLLEEAAQALEVTAHQSLAFKIYKPTPPRLAVSNVNDAELPWVYDQDPSSGNVASMWVTPVKATPQLQREWVGLTQEDIDIAFDDTQEGGGFNEFAEAIEQTLRRKNS